MRLQQRSVAALVVVLLVTWCAAPATAAGVIEVKTCAAATEYYSIASMTCQTCSAQGALEGRVPDPTVIGVFGDAAQCTCAQGYKQAAASCSVSLPSVCGPFTCTSCATLDSTTVASRDRTRCMKCGTDATLDATIRECVCSISNAVLVEESITGEPLAEKMCAACPANTRVFLTDTGAFKADRYSCQKCPDPNMVFNSANECVCATDYTLAGIASQGTQRCLPSLQVTAIEGQYPATSAATVTYSDVIATDGGAASSATVATSLLFQHLYMQAAVRCFNWASAADDASCQALGNLCVLQHYNPAATVCQLVQRIVDTRAGTVNEWPGWATTMPFLQYKNDAEAVTKSLDLAAKMSFDAGTQAGTHEWAQFKLAKFSVNGTFLGLEDLSHQLLYCSSSGSTAALSRPRWLKYGVSTHTEVACDLGGVLAKEQIMYDLYMVDLSVSLADVTIDANGLPTNIYPVPIRNINYRENSAQPNVNSGTSDVADDKLSRRFFLFDKVSGVERAGEAPTVMRFAQRLTLTVTGQQDASVIYPPVLTIEYSERKPSTFAATPALGNVTITFEVHYTTDFTFFWTFAIVLFTLCMVLTFIHCCIRMLNWSRRSTRTYPERALTLSVLMRMAAYLAGSFATFSFWLLISLSMYWVLFFKVQDAVFTLLPPDSTLVNTTDYEVFDAMLIACWVGMLIRLAEVLYTQTHTDIFFLDWEKERNPPVTLVDTEAGMEGGFEGAGAGGREGHRPAHLKKRATRFPMVSAWRTILAANEWCEIQTTRKTSLSVTLLWLLFLLRGLGLEYLATPQPTMSDLTPGKTNRVLLFGFVSLFWLLAVGVQNLWRWSVYHRWIAEPPTTRFIDLCTMAKVSILVLPNRYHGYYLHCRSNHEFADNNMVGMAEALQREKENLSVERGLDGCPEGLAVQTFEIFVTKMWRKFYDRVDQAMHSTLAESRAGFGAEGSQVTSALSGICGSVPRRNQEATAKVLNAQQHLSEFMQRFVRKSDNKYPWTWKAHTIPTRVFRMPPEFDLSGDGDQTSLMYADEGMVWSEVMFWGMEMELVMFNILTFGIITLMFDNTVVSACLTYFVQWLVTKYRDSAGKHNVARKTVVDSRFMV